MRKYRTVKGRQFKSVTKTFLDSCAKYEISETTAREIAYGFKEEFGFFPSSYVQSLRLVE